MPGDKGLRPPCQRAEGRGEQGLGAKLQRQYRVGGDVREALISAKRCGRKTDSRGDCSGDASAEESSGADRGWTLSAETAEHPEAFPLESPKAVAIPGPCQPRPRSILTAFPLGSQGCRRSLCACPQMSLFDKTSSRTLVRPA